MSLNPIPRSLLEDHSDARVHCIYAAAYSPNEIFVPTGSPSAPLTNHWVLLLVLSDAQLIQLDPSPGGTDMRMALIATEQDCAVYETFVFRHQLSVTSLTVGGFITHIQESKFIQYRLSDTGQGCRFWIFSTLDLLQRAGYLEKEQLSRAVEALGQVWGVLGMPVSPAQQTGMVAGEFYEAKEAKKVHSS